MKKFFKPLTFLLCLSIIFSTVIFSNAYTTSNDTLTYNEFYHTVCTAFSEHGKELIMEYDENHIYTSQDVAYMLDFLENDKIKVVATEVKHVPTVYRLMPSAFNYSHYFTVSSSQTYISYATFELIVKGTIDLQGNNVMGIDSNQIVFRSGINYSSNTLSATCTRDKSIVRVKITGSVLFSYTEPNTGLNFSVNEPVTYYVNFDAGKYI